MEIHHLRSATAVIAVGPHRLLLDPMLSDPGAMPGFKLFGGGRRRNPLVPLPAGTDALLERVTGVVVTHEHPDHFDAPARDRIRARSLPVWAHPIDAPSLTRKGLDARPLSDGARVFDDLEALDHCPTTRHGLRARLAEAGLSAHVPEDGEVLRFTAAGPAVEPRVVAPARPGLQKLLAAKMGDTWHPRRKKIAADQIGSGAMP